MLGLMTQYACHFIATYRTAFCAPARSPFLVCSVAFPVPVDQHQLLVSLGDLTCKGYKNLVLLKPDESAYGYGQYVHRYLTRLITC